MTSSTTNTSTPTEDIDLGYLLAPLTRQNLEMIIVHLVSNRPTSINYVLQQCYKPVDRIELHTNLLNIIELTSHNIVDICGDIEIFIERINDYIRIEHITNACTMLDEISDAIVRATVDDRERIEEDEENRKSVESFYSLLVTNKYI
jgi:hypothetical protein